MIGLVVREQDTRRRLALIERAEALGVPAVWLTTAAAGPDGLTVFAAAALRTSRLRLGTSIVPTWPRHPVALAQQAQVVAALAPGRLRLGVGPSTAQAMEPLVGARWRRPLEHLREYVVVLKTLLQTGEVDFAGRQVIARARLPAPIDVPVLASALRTGAYRLCGEVADGAISWMTPWPYIEERALPALRAGAEAAGRPAPPVIVHVPVCVHDDVEAVRAAAREQVGAYPRIPAYAAMMTEAGFEVTDELSDALIDALVVHGSVESVAQGLRRFVDRGAGEVIAHPLTLAEDAEGSLERALAANRGGERLIGAGG